MRRFFGVLALLVGCGLLLIGGILFLTPPGGEGPLAQAQLEKNVSLSVKLMAAGGLVTCVGIGAVRGSSN